MVSWPKSRDLAQCCGREPLQRPALDPRVGPLYAARFALEQDELDALNEAENITARAFMREGCMALPFWEPDELAAGRCGYDAFGVFGTTLRANIGTFKTTMSLNLFFTFESSKNFGSFERSSSRKVVLIYPKVSYPDRVRSSHTCRVLSRCRFARLFVHMIPELLVVQL